VNHYEAGVRIGELSLDPHFDVVLPWSCLDNRPFLRCMPGYGLCLWRLKRFEEAEKVFMRMLWLNPSDNYSLGLVALPALKRSSQPLTISLSDASTRWMNCSTNSSMDSADSS